jgi:hypothetical protein
MVLSVVTTGVSVVGSSPVFAAGYCKAPYLAQGSSSYIDGTTVTATVNEASDGGDGRYLHQSAMTPPKLDTTWTFAPAITKVQFETENHDDADIESYAFTAKDGSGNTVATFDITDVDGFDERTFGTPVASISVTYTPDTSPGPGDYGSFLYLYLDDGGDGVCSEEEPSEPTSDYIVGWLEDALKNPTPEQLPATGGDIGPLPISAALVAFGVGLLLVRRRLAIR